MDRREMLTLTTIRNDVVLLSENDLRWKIWVIWLLRRSMCSSSNLNTNTDALESAPEIPRNRRYDRKPLRRSCRQDAKALRHGVPLSTFTPPTSTASSPQDWAVPLSWLSCHALNAAFIQCWAGNTAHLFKLDSLLTELTNHNSPYVALDKHGRLKMLMRRHP